MPNGSIPHGKQRSNSVKRHASGRENQPKSDEIRQLDVAMVATLIDILALTRRYIRFHAVLKQRGEYGEITEFDPQLIIASLVVCAQLPDTDPTLAPLFKKSARLRGEQWP